MGIYVLSKMIELGQTVLTEGIGNERLQTLGPNNENGVFSE